MSPRVSILLALVVLLQVSAWAIAQGVEPTLGVAEKSEPELLELGAAAKAHRAQRRFVGGLIKGGIQKLTKGNLKEKSKFTGAAARLRPTDVRCVLCQYMVQRVKAEMLVNGIGGGLPFGAAGGRPMVGVERGGPYADTPSSFTPPPAAEGSEASFLETEVKTERRNIFASVRGVMASGKARLNRFLNGPQLQRNGREKQMDMLVFRPWQQRYSGMYDGPMRSARRAEDRYENNQMYSIVYRVLEDICTQKMPKAFYPYCGAVMESYQKIVSGLKWKDRPDAICMALDMCDANSYVQQGPHSTSRDY